MTNKIFQIKSQMNFFHFFHFPCCLGQLILFVLATWLKKFKQTVWRTWWCRGQLLHLSRRWKNPVSAAVLQNTKLLFFGGDEHIFEIYDISTETWSVGELPQSIMGVSVYSFDNTVYLAGMGANGVFSTQVWKLEF